MSNNPPDSPELKKLATTFRPGVFVHYKGDAYRALFVAWESTNAQTREPKVVYVSLTDEHGINVRSLSEWNELIKWNDGRMRPRFNRVAD